MTVARLSRMSFISYTGVWSVRLLPPTAPVAPTNSFACPGQGATAVDGGSGLGLGLSEHRPSERLDKFDEQNPGLDHVDSPFRDPPTRRIGSPPRQQGRAHSGLVTSSYGTVLRFTDPDGLAGILAPAQASDPSACPSLGPCGQSWCPVLSCGVLLRPQVGRNAERRSGDH